MNQSLFIGLYPQVFRLSDIRGWCAYVRGGGVGVSPYAPTNVRIWAWLVAGGSRALGPVIRLPCTLRRKDDVGAYGDTP
jgi:hypothetical protein